MDNNSLGGLLGDERERQFWLKPVGPPKDHPDWCAEEHRTWTTSEIEIHFSKRPAAVVVGDILVAYRVRYGKLIYVAECLPREEWSEEEPRSEDSRRRWPHYIKARNLTPEYGNVWNYHCLQPFPLARVYNITHPADLLFTLGSIQFGADKASISRGFAEFLIRRIRELRTPVIAGVGSD